VNKELTIKCTPLLTAVNISEGFRNSFELCPRRTTAVEGKISDDKRKLILFWKETVDEDGGRGGIAVKYQTVDRFTSLSLADHVGKVCSNLNFGQNCRQMHFIRHLFLYFSLKLYRLSPLSTGLNSSEVELTVTLQRVSIFAA